jgi:hypothetical protein
MRETVRANRYLGNVSYYWANPVYSLNPLPVKCSTFIVTSTLVTPLAA